MKDNQNHHESSNVFNLLLFQEKKNVKGLLHTHEGTVVVDPPHLQRKKDERKDNGSHQRTVQEKNEALEEGRL